MKSQVNAVWLAGGSVLAIIGVLSFSLAYQVHSVVRGLHERNSIEAINEMEFVKKALHQSLIYSTYQSVYETLKYGGYPTEGCDPKTSGDGIPYLRTKDSTCPPEILDETIEKGLQSKFGEYIITLRAKSNIIDIQIPDYKSVTAKIIENQVDVQASTDEKLKFTSENIEISDSPNVKATLKLRISDLVSKAIKYFVLDDPVKKQIESAETQLSNIQVNKPLSSGKLTGNCKSTKFEACFPPDIKYTYPSKFSMLPENCEKNFVTTIVNNTNNLDLDSEVSLKTSANSIKSYVDVEKPASSLLTGSVIAPIEITPELTTGIESNCEKSQTANYTDCGCIKWECSSSTPVRIGTEIPQQNLPFTTTVSDDDQNNDVCSPCAKVIPGNETNPDVCVQFTEKTCPSGYEPVTNGISTSSTDSKSLSFSSVNLAVTLPPTQPSQTPPCVKSTNPLCPTDYVEFDKGCVQLVKKECNDVTYNTFIDGYCYNFKDCEEDPCPSIAASCPAGYKEYDQTRCRTDPPTQPSCPEGFTTIITADGSIECKQYSDKKCPSEAPKEVNGKCYATPVKPTCAERETLYIKTCDYDYSAEADVLVSVKDNENTYPVYDNGKADLKNLELQFYVLSKG